MQLFTKMSCSVVIVIFLGGCATGIRGFPKPASDYSKEALPDPAYYLGPQSVVEYNEIAADTSLSNTVRATRLKQLRNNIIDARTLEIDKRFGVFIRKLRKEGTSINLAMDFIGLALTGAVATIGGESTKAALGAAATGLKGAQESYSKRAFLQKAMDVLITQMSAGRTEVRNNLKVGTVKPVETYSVYAALGDLEAYELAGSIPAALSATAKTAAKKEDDSNKEVPDKIKEAQVESLRFELINSLPPADALVELEAFGTEESQEAPEANN